MEYQPRTSKQEEKVMNVLDWIIIIVSIFIITIVALQSSKDDLGQALTGGNSELFKNQKERGVELVISRTTLVSTILFIVLTFLASVF